MGKLILMFTDVSDHITINVDDFVISNLQYPAISVDKIIVVNPNELPLADYRDQLEIVKTEFKKHLTNKLQEEAFLSCYNNFYNHIFRSLMKWIYAIDQALLKTKFDEIVLSDFVDSNFYLPYYEAEGEINSKLFYCVYDFIPFYIKSYLSTNHGTVRIVNIHPKASLICRIFIRRYVLLAAKFMMSIRSHIKFKFNPIAKNESVPETDTMFVFLSRGLAHTHYLLPYLDFNKENTLLFVSDGIKSSNKNINYFNSLDLRGYSYLKFLRFFDYFKVLAHILFSLVRTVNLPMIKVDGVNLKFVSSLREMLISYYEVELYRISLERFVRFLKKTSNAKLVLITAEMFTPFTFVTAKVGNSFEIKTLQLQTSLIDYWPQTSFTYCNKFIFTSKQALNFYRENNPNERHKYDYWGMLTEVKKHIEKTKICRILYFTQPYENEIELSIVKSLKKIAEKVGAKLFIKLHPRDSKDKFNPIRENIFFLEASQVLSSYIKDFDVVVVRTSAIGKEAIIAGVPTIISLFSYADQTIKVDFIQEKYKKFKSFVYNADQLTSAIVDFDITFDEFIKFRNSFINDNGLSDDVHSFDEKLNNFLRN